jgi:hypothetical protein
MYGFGFVSLDWQSSAEGKTILQHFYDPQTTGRKVLGIYVFIYEGNFINNAHYIFTYKYILF